MASFIPPVQTSGGSTQQAKYITAQDYYEFLQNQQLQALQAQYAPHPVSISSTPPTPKVKSITVPIPGWIDLHFDTGADFAFRISLITCITEKCLVYMHNGSVTYSDISGLDRAELMDKIACAANLEAAQRNLTSPAPTL